MTRLGLRRCRWGLVLGSSPCLRKSIALMRRSSSVSSTRPPEFNINVEERWRMFFLDPTQWWDHRSEKTSARYPDFTHKKTKEPLYLNGRLNPEWVKASLDAMAPFPVQRNRFSWNAILARHVKNKESRKTLELFQQMQEEGMKPDGFTFVAVLKACGSLAALEEGYRIHAKIIQSSFASDVFVGCALIDMYAKCSRIEDARVVFDRMRTRDVVVWTAIIKGYVKSNQGETALDLFRQMQKEGIQPDAFNFVVVLNACANVGALEQGQLIHAQVNQSRCDSQLVVGNSLVDMYAKCGSIEDARRVFNDMPIRNIVSWNALIMGYVKCGQEEKAQELFEMMLAEGQSPDSVTFVGILKTCTNASALEKGKQLHEQIIKSRCEVDGYLGSSLVEMYSKCGSIGDADRLFNELHTRDAVCWNVMIKAHAQCGQGERALELFEQMRREQVQPNSVTCLAALTACASVGALEEGKGIHALIIENGWDSSFQVRNSLMNMYAKCGSIEDAWKLFKTMPTTDVVSWNAMILGYVRCGQGEKALDLFHQMRTELVKPDSSTFVGVLHACASLGAIEEGRDIHAIITESGYQSDAYVCSSLVDMYAKCGCIEDAWDVFCRMTQPDVVSQNAMIAGYVRCGQADKALELYQQMQDAKVEVTPVTFVGALNACASKMALDEGRILHSQIIQSGFESDIYVLSSLIDMYAKCGSIDDAWKVFSKTPSWDVVVWTAMILGYARNGQVKRALQLCQQMEVDGVEPNQVTFVGMLNACANALALEEGKLVHAWIAEAGWESDIFVGSSLVDMYAKCGSTENARSVFDKMPSRDVVTWNTMIMAYVKCGQAERAVELYQKMQVHAVEPDHSTFVGVLSACSNVVALQEGKRVHTRIIEKGHESSVSVCNSLIDMYAKCGSIKDAWSVFDKMPTRNVVSWNSMLGGLGYNGLGKEAVHLFQQMHHDGVDMNWVTFVCLLSACSHAGLVEEGLQFFESMSSKYGISPTVEHYSCVVDLLGRAGRLVQAEKLINTMSCEPDVAVWKALLGACRVHGDLEMGERIANQVLKLDPQNASGYVLLSNIYAAAGKWDSCANIQQLRIPKGCEETAGMLLDYSQ